MITGGQTQFDGPYQSQTVTDYEQRQQPLPDVQSQSVEVTKGDGNLSRGEFHPIRVNQPVGDV